MINHQPKNEQQITMQINLYGALFKPRLHPLFVKINNKKTAIENDEIEKEKEIGRAHV